VLRYDHVKWTSTKAIVVPKVMDMAEGCEKCHSFVDGLLAVST